MQYGLPAPVDDGMPGVMPALKAHHGGRVPGQQIHNFALALIAPLGAEHNNIFTHLSRFLSQDFLDAPGRILEHELPLATHLSCIGLLAFQLLNKHFALCP